MRIACPHCGPRGLDEFLYTQDASLTRPRDGGAVPTQEWVDYVYIRENAKGPRKEFWYHSAGCHAWLVVTRDVVSHEILAVELP
jgi:sarcosine oxidase subunit delta